MAAAYPRLFAPLQIRSLRLRNRIVFPPMQTSLAATSGEVGEHLAAHLVRRAAGGAGLVYLEFGAVEWPRGKNGPVIVNLAEQRFVPALRRLVERVHAQGAQLGVQIAHGGRQSSLLATDGVPLVSASSAVPSLSGAVPETLSTAEIGRLVEAFAAAAERCHQAGFDVLELHGAHGYLITQFLSPYINRRQDQYGGSLENRARFLLEIVAAVRARLGPEPVLSCRLSGSDFLSGGLTVEDTAATARLLERAGVDLISVGAGVYESREYVFPPATMARGMHLPLARAVKQAVSLPVIAVGKLDGPELAEEALARGDADLIAMGRGLVADPDLPRKLAAGRPADVRPCIYCNECIHRIRRSYAIGCSVNPEAGRDVEFQAPPAPSRGRIAVVGGGPAGMEAALRAAQRGYRVTLYERDGALGGQLRLLGASGLADDLPRLVDFWRGQLEEAGVELALLQAVTPELLRERGFAGVIVATGSRPRAVQVPGAGDGQVVDEYAVLAGRYPPGPRVAVLGNGMHACAPAAALARAGFRVTLVAREAVLGPQMELAVRAAVGALLARQGVEILLGAQVQRLAGRVLEATGPDGAALSLEVDGLVAAAGARPDRVLADQSAAAGLRVLEAGDCARLGGIGGAVYSGAVAGRRI